MFITKGAGRMADDEKQEKAADSQRTERTAKPKASSSSSGAVAPTATVTGTATRPPLIPQPH